MSDLFILSFKGDKISNNICNNENSNIIELKWLWIYLCYYRKRVIIIVVFNHYWYHKYFIVMVITIVIIIIWGDIFLLIIIIDIIPKVTVNFIIKIPKTMLMICHLSMK